MIISTPRYAHVNTLYPHYLHFLLPPTIPHALIKPSIRLVSCLLPHNRYQMSNSSPNPLQQSMRLPQVHQLNFVQPLSNTISPSQFLYPYPSLTIPPYPFLSIPLLSDGERVGYFFRGGARSMRRWWGVGWCLSGKALVLLAIVHGNWIALPLPEFI